MPVLTLLGERHAERMTASVLTQAGLPEWIAQTPEEWVEKGRTWTERQEELAALREALREKVKRSALCDGQWFTREVEAAYREMWRRTVTN